MEVGCGRGGGAALVAQEFGPASLVGVDYSPANVAFCTKRFDLPGLRFVHGDAEALAFPDSSFDVVVNIESAHCYPSVDRFFAEVFRVLRPGGQLLLADEWWSENVAELHRHITDAGLRIVDSEDLTEGVIRALHQLRGPMNELLVSLPDGPSRRTYDRFFNERVGRESTHSYTSGRFRFIRMTAQRPHL
jgi:SAM-dependent methyltransferase